jgi:hypothetical protein
MNLGKSLRIGLVVILVVAAFAALAYAQDYTVGVKAGDWVKYGQITVTWTGNGTEPSTVIDAKKIDWERIDVLNVKGTTASVNYTTPLNNGTQIFASFDVDVHSELLGMQVFIASNLKVGDPIGAGVENTVNQTVTRMYAGANRNINIIYYRNSPYLTYFSWESQFYYDQDTGIMVEEHANETYYYSTPGVVAYQVQLSAKATETNLWSASPLDIVQNNLIYIIAGAAAVIIILAATIGLRKRKLLAPQQPPPAPHPHLYARARDDKRSIDDRSTLPIQ